MLDKCQMNICISEGRDTNFIHLKSLFGLPPKLITICWTCFGKHEHSMVLRSSYDPISKKEALAIKIIES